MNVTPARWEDLDAIVEILASNRDDPSLFQQPRQQLGKDLRQFLVARHDGAVVGCIQILPHAFGSVELLAVAVHAEHHGRGIGSALMSAAIERARALATGEVWLGTAKPGYFARHGFSPMTRWKLPLLVLIGKLRRVSQQPAERWIPSVFGRHVFMSLTDRARPVG